MIDKEIVLAFINGPGSSLAVMWISLLGFIFAVYGISREYNAREIRRQVKEDAQRGALQNIEQMLRVIRSEQDQFRKQIEAGVVVND
jgi:hypothetical protein